MFIVLGLEASRLGLAAGVVRFLFGGLAEDCIADVAVTIWERRTLASSKSAKDAPKRHSTDAVIAICSKKQDKRQLRVNCSVI
jgi:hypothetical protein